MIALGLVLLALGIVRAFRHPDLCRGTIFGSVLAVLALAFSARFHAAGFAESPSEFDGCVEFSVHSRECNLRREGRGPSSRRGFDFLPWILVTVLQLRVTEFREGAAGV